MAKWKANLIFLFFNVLLLVIMFGILLSRQKFSVKRILMSERDFHVHANTDSPISQDAPLLIPDDRVLDNMSQYEHLVVYQRYVNTLQALCKNIIRVGSLRDGGKEICVDEAYKPKAPCLVYSFGIANKWDFDETVVDMFGCEVHCFDPSIHRQTSRISDKIWFYDIGLGATDMVDRRGWTIRTLNTIREDLNHTDRPIDILKIDIEADEWKAIPQMVESGALDDVKQLAIELHFPLLKANKNIQWRGKHTNMPLSALRKLYEAGFRLVMRERNTCCPKEVLGFKNKISLLYEVTLIKT